MSEARNMAMQQTEEFLYHAKIVQITVMEPHDLDANRYGVIRKGSDMRGFGVTLQDAFDDCKVVNDD